MQTPDQSYGTLKKTGCKPGKNLPQWCYWKVPVQPYWLVRAAEEVVLEPH